MFLNMLYDFCKEMNIFIEFSLDKIEYYNEFNVKSINEFVTNDKFRNHTSMCGINMTFEHYSKNEIIFAVLQKLGFQNELFSSKKETEIIQTIKFIIDELDNTICGKFSLEVNDFPGRPILNMISDLVLNKKLLDTYFDGESHLEKIFNACVVEDQRF